MTRQNNHGKMNHTPDATATPQLLPPTPQGKLSTPGTMDAAPHSPRSALQPPEAPRLPPPAAAAAVTKLARDLEPNQDRVNRGIDTEDKAINNNVEHTATRNDPQPTQHKVRNDPRHHHIPQGKLSTPGITDAASYSHRPASKPHEPPPSPSPSTLCTKTHDSTLVRDAKESSMGEETDSNLASGPPSDLKRAAIRKQQGP